MKRSSTERVELFETATCQKLVKRLGANIRRLREAKGWSQEECAFQSHFLEPSMLRTIEAGRANLTISTLARLCDGLGVEEVADLFVATDPFPKRRRGRPPKQSAPQGAGDERVAAATPKARPKRGASTKG